MHIVETLCRLCASPAVPLDIVINSIHPAAVQQLHAKRHIYFKVYVPLGMRTHIVFSRTKSRYNTSRKLYCRRRCAYSLVELSPSLASFCGSDYLRITSNYCRNFFISSSVPVVIHLEWNGRTPPEFVLYLYKTYIISK